MRKFFLLLLFVILCGQYLVYGQRGFDSLPEPNIHIKFGDPIVFTPVEGAESYRFLFSLYGHVDTIQTTTPYISASEYTGMPLFETYDITMQYYKNSVWHVSEESNRVMIVTDSGTDFLIHDMVKAGQIPSATSSEEPEFDLDTADIIYIPIVYHVIVPSWFNGEPTEYLNPAKINQSMDILNKVFAGETGELGVDTKIRFRPVLTDSISYCEQNYYGITYNVYNGNNINIDDSVSHPGNNYIPTIASDQLLGRYYDYFSPDSCINIWVFDNIIFHSEEVFGITSSPCLMIGNPPILAITKGVCGENPNIPSKQLGYTVAHEMGHYFGLWHAWIEQVPRPATVNGVPVIETVDVPDGIDDTPDYPGPVLGCDYSRLDAIPYDNIMSYTPDGCRYRFTIGQANRMRRKIHDIFSDYVGAADTASILPDILGVRIVSPGSNYICNNSDFDIKLSTYDISVFQRLEITMNDNSNFRALVFNNSEFVQEGELYVKHVHLEQPLPTGEYNFTLYSGENGCTSISKRFNFIDCNNSVDSTQAQWYFDSYVTLDFRSGIAQLGEFSAMNASWSESGICDESGNILFYTDGDKIWNGNHELIDSLNQYISYKGTIVLKFDETHYAVVSICDNGQLVSRLIEHGQSFNNISAYIYEEPYLLNGLTAVPCPTGGYWLVSTTESGSNSISIKLRYNGTSLVYENGCEWNLNSQRYTTSRPITLKASPNGKYIAYASDNCLKLAYFNATHGTFSPIDCEIHFTTKRTSTAFSPNGRFLYIVYQDLGIDGKLKIVQYDLNNDYSCNCQGIRSNDVFSADNSGEYFRTNLYLQEGPDGRIYFSRFGDFFSSSKRIGVIMEPDDLASTFNGYEDCHVVEDLIDYDPSSILQNWENLPNLVDAKDIDTCAASFTICSSDCSLESLTLHNFSLSPTLTWSFYDLSGNLIATNTDTVPDLSSITQLHNRNAFIIKQSTACEDHYMIDTVSFDAQMQIVGQDSICIDGSSYIYTIESNNLIRNIEWNIDSINGDFHYNQGMYSDLMVHPSANDCNFNISCNILDKYGCRDTAQLNVSARKDCSFVANVTHECNGGNIVLTNNACVDMSNDSATIIIEGIPYGMQYVNNSFLFEYRNIYNDNHNYGVLLDSITERDLDATIIVTDNTGNTEIEMEVLIPRTNTSVNVDGVVIPAICELDLCYVSLTVSDGVLSHIIEYGHDSIPVHCMDTLPNGDLVYYVGIRTLGVTDTIYDNCWALIDSINGGNCTLIKPISLPYQRIKPTFYISHSDVCHEGGSGTIAIEMELPRIESVSSMFTEWQGDWEGQTDFELTDISTYTTVLNNNSAQGNIGQGTYIPIVNYSANCRDTLDPVTITVLSPEVQEPEIEVSTTYACSNMDNGTITIEILSGVEEGFDPYVIWNGGTHISEFELSPDSTKYTTTWNAGASGNYSATVFYTSSCAETLYTSIQSLSSPHFNISHTEICNVSDTASITVEMELANTDNGFTPYAYWNNGEQTYFVLQEGSNSTYTTTLTVAGHGSYSADVYYTSYCSAPLPTTVIDVSNISVNYNYISENSVGIHLHFTPPANNYIVSVAGHEEDIINGNIYNFAANSIDTVEIITPCDTIPLDFRVFDVSYTDSLYGPCQKIETQIRFTISGGSAPYTATFTNGDYTNTMTINNAGSVVMNVEIMQGEANHLTVVSANGDTYNINLGTIDFISNYAVLETSSLGATYNGGTYIVPTGLTFDHDVTFTNCTIYCAYTDYDDITSTQWTVNSGKTVTFNHCTIMSGCPDKMWQGIKVIGEALTHIDPPSPPLPNEPSDGRTRATALFGKIICDNTTIEDAIKAIESIRSGKIIANGSHFNNNQYDLYYNRYVFAQGSATAPTITNCTFSTTRLLNDNSIFPEAHIWMKGTSGMYIGGCTFENTIPHSTAVVPEIGTPYYTDRRGIGIQANTSHFELYTACNFDKLFYGVHSSGFKSKAVVVENSSFTGNHRAIYINNNDGCKVLNNNIVSRGEPGEQYEIMSASREDREVDYSVFIGSCHTFTFEQNTISNATTGLYVYNSGTLGNQIRYNTFEGRPDDRAFQLGLPIATKPQYNAIVVVGKNSDYITGNNQTGRTGLEILCNTFRRNTRDIFVKDGYMRQQQGSSSAPTGNSFLFADLTGSHKQFLTQFSNTSMSNQYDVYTKYEYYQHRPSSSDNEYKHQLIAGYYNTNKITTHDYNSDYSPRYCQCSDGTGPVVDPYPFNPVPFPGVDRTKSHIQQLGTTLDSAVNEYETKLDGGNTANALTKISTISTDIAPSINDLPQDGYLSDTVCNALVAKIEENPVYVTSVFVENSPLPAATYEDVQDAEISQILKTVLSYYQSGENKRVTDEKAIGDIKQEISLNENLLYDKALNDSLSDTDYAIILDYFNTKTDIDSKIMACNILTSSENYDEARQQISSIRSLGTTEAINCADVMEMYINTIDTDTIMTKEMLKQKRSQLENFMADNNYLYSGLAITLYEYAFDTLIPEYTPLFEDEITQKSSKTEATAEIYPYAIYPNPTSDFINIELASNVLDDDIIEFLKRYGMEKIEDCENIEINIFDVNSRLVNTGKYKYDTLISIDVKNYPSGTYLVEIKSCYDNVMQTKIVKL